MLPSVRRPLLVRSLVLIALVALFVADAPRLVAAGLSQGSAAVSRLFVDGAAGQLFIYGGGTFDPGTRASTITWYVRASGAGKQLTPILFEETEPGVYAVRGIGTPRVSVAGLNTASFDVTYGSDVITNEHFTWGWVNSSVAPGGAQSNATTGAVDFNYATGGFGIGGLGTTNVWYFTPSTFGPGAVLSLGFTFGLGGGDVMGVLDGGEIRAYSAYMTVVPNVAPEVSATPRRVELWARAGAVSPYQVPTAVTSTTAFDASSDAPWMTFTPASGGAGSSTVGIGADATTLAPGLYTGTATFVVEGGTPASVAVTLHVANPQPALADSSSVLPTTRPELIETADFNRDGRLDVVVYNTFDPVTNTDSNLQVFTSAPGGGFAVQQYDVPGSLAEITTGDYNGDGWTDIAGARWGRKTIDLLTSDGAGTFVLSTLSTGIYDAPSLASGDLDSDGRDDLIFGSYFDDVVVVMRSSEAFAPTVVAADCSSPGKTAVGDFTGDGLVDIAVSCDGEGQIKPYLNNGNGGFAHLASYSRPGNAPWMMRVADLNGDGLQDLVTGSYSAPAAVHLGDAIVGLKAGNVSLPTGRVVIGDVNGDGYPDIAVVDDPAVTVYAGGAGGVFSASGTFGNNFAARSLAVIDIDGDGANDVVGVSYDSLMTVLAAPAAETTSTLTRPQSAVFGQPFAFTLSVTSAAAAPPSGTAQLFLCDAEFVCDTPVSPVVSGAGTFLLEVTQTLPSSYRYFKARFTPDNPWTLASETNPEGLPIQKAPSVLTLQPLPDRPGGNAPFPMTATIEPSQATGVVQFWDAAHGILLASATLSNGVATASMPPLPPNLFYTIQATYGGDANVFDSSSGYVDFQVGPSSVPLTLLDVGDKEWTGQPQPATVSNPDGLPIEVTYNGLPESPASLPAAIGTYTVEARSTDPARPAYATATFSIVPNRNATAEVESQTVIYDGQPHQLPVVTSPAGLNVVLTFRNTDTNAVTTTPPIEPGSYQQLVDIDDARAVQLYQGVGVLVIEKKTATVTLTDLVQTLDGTNNGPTVTTDPAGLNVTLTYNGLPNPQGLGTYTVVATVDDPHWKGTATGTYVLQLPPFTVGGTEQTYDGTAKTVTVTPTVPGTPYAVTYDGSATAPTDAGAYSVVVTSTDPARPGSVQAVLLIQKVTPVISVSGTTQPYTGSPRPVTVTTTPAVSYTVTYGSSTTAPSTVGAHGYTVTISDPNANPVVQSGTLTITKGTATVQLSDLTQGENGQYRRVTVVTDPAGLATVVTYDGSTTPPITAGTYTVVATVTDSNYTGSATATLSVVPKATTTIGVQYGNIFLFRADPQVQPQQIAYGQATVSVTVSGSNAPSTGRIQVMDSFNGGPLAVLYDSLVPVGLPATFTVTLPVGSHRIIAGYQGDDLNQPASFTSDFRITRATPSITPDFTSLTQIFNGTPRSVPFTVLPAGTTYTVTYNGSPTPPTDAGSYRVVFRVTDPNVVNTSASYTLTINKMPATVTLDNLTQVADGEPKAPIAISNPALPPGYEMEFTFDGRRALPSRIGSYTVVASNPNITGTATGTFTLLAPLSVTGGTFTYDGTPKAATVNFTAPITRLRSVVYEGPGYNSEAPPTNAGTYTVTVTGCGGGNGCNNVVTATLVINKAQVGLGFGALTNPTTGGPVPVTVTWSPTSLQNVPITVLYDGSTSAPVNAGAYAVTASVNSPNFIAQTISATYFVVPGQTQMTLTSRVVNWNGAPQSLTATISPSNAPYTLTYTRAGGLPSTTSPTEAGLYAVTMTATGGYTGEATATLDIRGFLQFGSEDPTRPFTFTLDGRRVAAGAATPVSAGPHTVVAEGRQISALERYGFDRWRGDYVGVTISGAPTAMPSTVTSLGPGFLVAVPRREYAVITSVVEGNGTVTGDGWYGGTAQVTLVATPAPGYLFERFTIDGQDVFENGHLLSMAGAGHRVRVHFVQASTVTTVASPAGAGSVAGAGIVPIGSRFTVQAVPAQGFRFARWDVTGGTIPGFRTAAFATPAEIRATATNVVVTAVFEPIVDAVFSGARFSLGTMTADVTIINRSTVAVDGLQLIGVTDSSRLLRLDTALPLGIGSLAPGQAVTYSVSWTVRSGVPPPNFEFSVTLRSGSGAEYVKTLFVPNY